MLQTLLGCYATSVSSTDEQRTRAASKPSPGFSPLDEAGSVLQLGEVTGDRGMWCLIFIVSVASIPLATEMARERARSPRVWFWVAALAGPLAPPIFQVRD